MLIFHDPNIIPPSLAASADSESIQECVYMVHSGCAVSAPQPFKFPLADSCHNGIITSQLNVAVVLFNYFCLAVKGLSAVGGCEFKSFHDVASFLCSCGLVVFGSLSTVCIIARKRSAVK